ncbi:U6 snRNA-associated Sm-like protein LSm6 [Hondaea fermentalgiana]|uniref:U6 snRNA-associated Sm-like protein LSm6 n=1 Tax=Hondaea fermentalgiana TaxID=2315210 RepID=A0A2R5G126_9STRA|nr:U6 snRNA-associated Sm-like protein LSm6 [Hondaea fermentalgiana]|eukprot:GBG23999.1 U6 snRNA-associated Sm-like protein LSm6 [Hondaea fermentalgiana]
MAETAAETPQAKRSPSDFIKQVIGLPVVVKLNSGTEYHGILSCLDGFMNIALEQADEIVDGKKEQHYNECFLRGNNVLYLSAAS